ncbi:MAG TPA: ATPase, T2SS/T4P/T4SS family [Rhodanobacteraceae bacterium]|nr:ATPase, T2SS/T4P/T4SS family [Rhodanobacteraceae bacterium]
MRAEAAEDRRNAPVMPNLQVLAAGRNLPRYVAVLTDQGQRYTVRAEDRRHVALLDLGASQYAIVWTNRWASKSTLEALLHRLSLDNLKVHRFYEAREDILGLLYRPDGVSANSVDRIDISPTQVTEMIATMVASAMEVRASDIHMQVDATSARIQFRVNGAMETYMELRPDQADVISNALFTMGDQDGKPTAFAKTDYQDASITHTWAINGEAKEVKLRFASLRTNAGWDVVLRVLDQNVTNNTSGLASLGYDEAQIFDFNRMLARPTGLVLLCGPTGSGKTTTTATLLQELFRRHEESHIIRTIEDPVEIVVPGLRQHPVVRSGGAVEDGFLKVFKACMRGDPDVLSVGEVRDHATAMLLQNAVQSGHMVFATLHSGDAFGAFSRLHHLGIARSDLTDETFISGIVNQKLLRLLCPDCSVPIVQKLAHLPPDLVRRLIRLSLPDQNAVRVAGDGCERCRGSRYIGRTVAAEIVIPDREILAHIQRDEGTLAKAYWRAGMSVYDKSRSGRTSLDQGIEKMAKGLVSPMDVERVLGPLDSQFTPEKEREWYRKAVRKHELDLHEERFQ